MCVCVFSLIFARDTVLALRLAEKEAKDNLRCLWADGSGSRAPTSSRALIGTCVEVLSGDLINVFVDADSESRAEGFEIKVALSSVR